MKKLLFILLLLPALSNAQVNLDSLWGVWNDATQADTNRLKAMQKISLKYLYTQSDSAFYFAQLRLDFAKEKGQKSENVERKTAKSKTTFFMLFSSLLVTEVLGAVITDE